MSSALAELTAGQWIARATIAAMPVVALLCLAGAGSTPPLWLVVTIALASLGWAAIPESALGAAILSVVVLCWGIRLGSRIDPFALPASAALLVAHVAAVVASYGPATMRLDGAVVRLWVRRAALVLLPVPAVHLLAARAHEGPAPDGIWLVGLGCVFAAIAVASVTLSAYADVSGER